MSLVEIEVCKALALRDDEQDLPDRVLRITAKLPESVTEYDGRTPLNVRERELAAFYTAQADMILAALTDLPGGTMHALLVRLLQRKVSLLQVPDPKLLELSADEAHALLVALDTPWRWEGKEAVVERLRRHAQRGEP